MFSTAFGGCVVARKIFEKMNWRILFVRLIALCKTLTMAVVVFRFYFQGSFKGIQGYWTGVCKAVCMGSWILSSSFVNDLKGTHPILRMYFGLEIPI